EHVRHGLANERKHATRAGVKEERSLVDDEDLIEGEAPRHHRRRHRCADAEDPRGDLVDVGSRRGIGHGHVCCRASTQTYGVDEVRYNSRSTLCASRSLRGPGRAICQWAKSVEDRTAAFEKSGYGTVIEPP